MFFKLRRISVYKTSPEKEDDTGSRIARLMTFRIEYIEVKVFTVDAFIYRCGVGSWQNRIVMLAIARLHLLQTDILFFQFALA